MIIFKCNKCKKEDKSVSLNKDNDDLELCDNCKDLYLKLKQQINKQHLEKLEALEKQYNGQSL